MDEIWKPIQQLGGRYEISNYGRLRNAESKKIRKTPTNKHGYQSVVMRPKEENGKPVNFAIHKLVAEAFLGVRPEGYVINHKDGDKGNNNVQNLEYVTFRENNLHALRTGLRKPAMMSKYSPKGEDHYQSKLTEDDVKEIRRIHEETGIGCRKIAKQFGVTSGCISNILARKSWKHI